MRHFSQACDVRLRASRKQCFLRCRQPHAQAAALCCAKRCAARYGKSAISACAAGGGRVCRHLVAAAIEAAAPKKEEAPRISRRRAFEAAYRVHLEGRQSVAIYRGKQAEAQRRLQDKRGMLQRGQCKGASHDAIKRYMPGPRAFMRFSSTPARIAYAPKML